MKTEIHFDGQCVSNGSWDFEIQDNGETKVTWGLSGEMGFFGRFIGAQMDKWVGPDFEVGLQNLKSYVESAAVAAEAAAESEANIAPSDSLLID